MTKLPQFMVIYFTRKNISTVDFHIGFDKNIFKMPSISMEIPFLLCQLI